MMTSERFSSSQETMSTPIEPYTAEQIRFDVLPRSLHGRSLTRRMRFRLAHAHRQQEEALIATVPDRVHAWAAVIATTWTLIENTLKLYETIVSHIDTKTEEGRISLQTRFMRERDPDEEVTFHARAWLFQVFDHVDGQAFTDAGIEVEEGREHLRHMIERSVAYLRQSETTLRSFYRRYRVIANAWKHGRALFSFAPYETKSQFGVNASDTAITALLAKKPGRGWPTRLVTFVADEEALNDVDTALSLLDVQIPRFELLMGGFAASAIAYLDYLEGHPPPFKPKLEFSLFADPYSPREAEVLAAIRDAPLRPPP